MPFRPLDPEMTMNLRRAGEDARAAREATRRRRVARQHEAALEAAAHRPCGRVLPDRVIVRGGPRSIIKQMREAEEKG
jgi:hypothetical protein